MIFAVGNDKALIENVYKFLCIFDVNVDVFDYFSCEEVFSEHSFVYKKKKFMLFENIYNCGFANTRMTERSVELALGQYFINECEDNIIEIGAVTPYYPIQDSEKIVHVVDPTDPHVLVDMRNSVFDCDLKGWNVLSISTVEHIGTSDYGMKEKYTSVDAINIILTESKTCMITAPAGYNLELDEWINQNKGNPYIRLLKRNCNNAWKEVDCEDIKNIKYGSMWADGLIVIEKSGIKGECI